MNLSIDIGNTKTKVGLFDQYAFLDVFSTEKQLDKALREQSIENVIVSKTGSNNSLLLKLRRTKVNTIEFSDRLKLPVHNLYTTPKTLGPDRIAGAVAANDLFRSTPVLKIDFGTCITYDFVSRKNEYKGGAISPGMTMRFKALKNYTARLPLISPLRHKKFDLTGTDTDTSILSGVVNGIKHEVEGVIKEYNHRYNGLRVVATGGDAALFATVMESEIFARPYLVLEGLNIILNNNI